MCELNLTPNASKTLQRLDAKLQRQILEKLEWLCENCHKPIHKPLRSNFKGHFKLRCGVYRVIYTYNKQTATIVVSLIGNRTSVYK